MTKISLDTNILIYAHDRADLHKQDIARDLIVKMPVISTQVVSEYSNVLKRITQFSKNILLDVCTQTLENCYIHSVEIPTLKIAAQIMERHDFQIFDSIIIASAIEAGCDILYSEDMQHNMLVDMKLKIVNPFL